MLEGKSEENDTESLLRGPQPGVGGHSTEAGGMLSAGALDVETMLPHAGQKRTEIL